MLKVYRIRDAFFRRGKDTMSQFKYLLEIVNIARYTIALSRHEGQKGVSNVSFKNLHPLLEIRILAQYRSLHGPYMLNTHYIR